MHKSRSHILIHGDLFEKSCMLALSLVELLQALVVSGVASTYEQVVISFSKEA